MNNVFSNKYKEGSFYIYYEKAPPIFHRYIRIKMDQARDSTG